MKPEEYPLPWCDVLDLPYWKINYVLCAHSSYYATKIQSGKRMADIIPVLDRRMKTLEKIFNGN